MYSEIDNDGFRVIKWQSLLCYLSGLASGLDGSGSLGGVLVIDVSLNIRVFTTFFVVAYFRELQEPACGKQTDNEVQAKS